MDRYNPQTNTACRPNFFFPLHFLLSPQNPNRKTKKETPPNKNNAPTFFGGFIITPFFVVKAQEDKQIFCQAKKKLRSHFPWSLQAKGISMDAFSLTVQLSSYARSRPRQRERMEVFWGGCFWGFHLFGGAPKVFRGNFCPPNGAKTLPPTSSSSPAFVPGTGRLGISLLGNVSGFLYGPKMCHSWRLCWFFSEEIHLRNWTLNVEIHWVSIWWIKNCFKGFVYPQNGELKKLVCLRN